MAARGWAHSTVTATGVAAGAAAAQLGIGYGLGVVAWQPVRDQAGETIWLASLSWVLWIAATATVAGAVVAQRLATRATSARAVELAWRATIAVAAAIGALVTVPLVMLPARAAKRVDNFQPEMTAGAYAVIGVIVGLVIAVAAVNVRVIAVNVILSAAWVWLLAVVSVTDAVRAGRNAGTAQLAAWQFTEGGWFRETLYFPGALLMLGGALLVGVFAALPADRREENRIAIAVSGVVGPLLVAAAYFLSAPKLTVRAEQLSAYLFAPYGVIAGLAGSALVASFTPLRPKKPAPASAPAGRPEPKPALADEAPTVPLRPVKSTAAKSAPVKSTPAKSTSDKAEQTVRLDATKPDQSAPTPAPAAAPAPAPTVTGRATVAQPLWPGRPRPRKRRDTRDT